MGQLLITGNGSEIDTSEITARAEDVVRGRTTVDYDGEIVEGVLPNNITSFSEPSDIKVIGDDNTGVVQVSFPEGVYVKTDDGRKSNPLIQIPFNTLRNKLNINSSQLLSNSNILGIRGSIPIYTGNRTVSSSPIINARDEAIGFPIASGYYGGSTIWSNFSSLKALLGGLNPNDLREGKTFMGVRGTMVDALSGGTVFRNATFYGILRGGLATNYNPNFKVAYKQYENNDTYYVDRTFPTTSIGSFKAPLFFSRSASRSEYWDLNNEPRFIRIFKNSINFKYFRSIKIQININENGVFKRGYVSAGVMSVDARPALQYTKAGGGTYYDTTARHILAGSFPHNNSLIIDVSNVNEHGFFYIVFSYEVDRGGSPPDVSNIDMEITNIEFTT